MVGVMILIMAVTYGTNIFLAGYFRSHPKVDVIERLSMLLGINMSVLFIDGILLFLGKLVVDGILLLE